MSTAGDGEVRIVRPKLRLLLAVLLARANTLVPVESLVDDMWGDDPPVSAVSNVRTYVWSLRRLLSPADPATAPISTDPQGYMIGVMPDCLDVLAFERLVANGTDACRRGDVPRAADRLEEALALWRGRAFQNVPFTTGTLVAEAQRLEEQRLAAVEELFDARLALGRHAEIVGELQCLVAQHPLRERLWGQMMLALYRDGQQAAALAAYQHLRTYLVEEIGVEPSPPLQALQSEILRSDPALGLSAGAITVASRAQAGQTPRQLPLDVPTFIGRAGELSTLSGLLLQTDVDGGTGEVVVIHGPPGAGKSALAVRAGNLWSTCFPDGQLYVNLRGATSGVQPLCPGECLGRFLRTLGILPEDVPSDLDEAGALFRSLVAVRRLLIVLDNAASAGQVRPLLPGLSRAAVLVTSRVGMSALEGASHLAVGPLEPDASQAMLERLIGDARTAADPTATARLAELCDHLPLGLHVAAARLKARPTWPVRRLVGRLTDERYRLTELAAGDFAVRSSVEVSYAALRRSDDRGDRAAARLLRLIGLLLVTDIDTNAAAALLSTSPAEADLVVERLLDAHLMEAVDSDRYHMHDLIRLFTRELAAETVGGDEANAAITRVLGYYLATAGAAVRLAFPHRAHFPVPEAPAAPKPLADPGEARRWLETERTNLLAVIRQAWPGPAEHARLGIGLTLALHWFLGVGGYPHALIELNEQAIPLARRVGDRRLEAYANGSIAMGLMQVRRYDEADAHIKMELSICREIGDRFGEQRALGNLGLRHLEQNRVPQAIACLEQQLTIAQQIGATIGAMYAVRVLGRAHHHLGRHEEAIRLTEKALAWYDETGDDLSVSVALERLGLIHIDLGRLNEAVDMLAQSVERARRAQYRLGEAHALIGLARARRLLGATDAAANCAAEAMAIADTVGATAEEAAADRECTAAHQAIDGRRG
ncbi:BTAD domain-containing putative transcriptional regulator [Actinoplanes sp. NPDC051513]|uniref:AfsR/SARP family transcriptional regulator n=1 Tax=Actinoplanes sp. NPDC051513 TaxID=3363908 RepID=UPI00378DD23B